MWWLPAVGLLAFSVLVYVGSAMHVVSLSPFVADREAAARESAVRDALAQAAPSEAAGNGRAAPTIQLRVGAGEDAVHIDVPVPFDARTPERRSRRSESAASSRDRALLATSVAVHDVVAFYRQQLANDGWHEVRTWMARPANGVSGPASAVSAFCREADSPALLVGVASLEAGRSEVRLMVESSQPGPCASSSESDPWQGRPPPMF